MFQNNNNKVIHELSNKSFKAGKSRNLFVIIALILTTFMITSVFSIGFSYSKTNELQNLRMMGTTAHAAITNVNEIQIKQIKQNKRSGNLSVAGLSHRLGNVDGKTLNGALLGLAWIDETEWNIHRMPTVSNIKGSYPTAHNEVMIPTWVLDKMGITEPSVGMEIVLNYKLTANDNNKKDEYKKEVFLLSGYYTDYMQVRTRDKGSVYVSEEFRNNTGISLENGGAVMLTFKDTKNVAAYCEKLKISVPFSAEQSFEIVPVYQQDNNNISVILGGAIAMITAAGYLLIYNILYISISKDIRSYGQLKTIGTTKKQIKRLIHLQVLKFSAIGIPIGLILGAIVSFGIVPMFLNVFSSENTLLGVSVSFSPFIFAWAGLFSLFTTMAACMKPAKIAAGISSVEAVKFTGVQSSKRKERDSRGGANMACMAWRNIFRNRKSSLLVFTSLFLGLTLFLLSTGILGSLNPFNYVNAFYQNDISIILSSASKNNVLTEQIADEIENIAGVQSVDATISSAPLREIPVEYTEDTYGRYIKSLSNNPKIKSSADFSDPEVINQYLSNFGSYVYGIDSMHAQKLGTVDMEAFENGEIILLCKNTDNNGNNLFEIGQEIKLVSNQTGKHKYIVGGFLEEDFQSGDRGNAPSIYMSKTALQKLSPYNKISRLDIETDKQEDAVILGKIKSIIGNTSDVLTKSRYEKEIQMAGYITTCKVMGTGLSVILLLIGIMNFVNTMFVSVTSRKQEIAVLESIGMTKKQTKKMLVLEGVYYFIISFTLLGTIGTGIFVSAFHVIKNAAVYASFSYPVLPLAAAAVTILIVCITVPLAAYRSHLQ